METVNLYYQKSHRHNPRSPIPKPHEKLERAVSQINRQYKRLGIPYSCQLVDFTRFIKGLNLEQLESLAGTRGVTKTKKQLVEKCLGVIPYYEVIKQTGLENIGGRWFRGERELSDLKFPFEITDDFKLRYGFSGESLNGRNGGTSDKRDLWKELYLEGSSYMFNLKRELGITNSGTENVILNAGLYINSIENLKQRKLAVRRLRKALVDEIKSSEVLHRVAVPEENKSDRGNYYIIRKNRAVSRIRPRFALFLVDSPMYTSYVNGRWIPHNVLSLHNGTPGYAYVANLDNMEEDGIRFIISHELGHLVGGADDFPDIHRKGDTHLMISPPFPNFLSGEDFALKLQDSSVKEAYSL